MPWDVTHAINFDQKMWQQGTNVLTIYMSEDNKTGQDLINNDETISNTNK